MAEISPLRRRMIEDMTVRNLSPATQRSYLSAVSKFSRYFGRSPGRLHPEDVRAFQVYLVATGISWPALNQSMFQNRTVMTLLSAVNDDLVLATSDGRYSSFEAWIRSKDNSFNDTFLYVNLPLRLLIRFVAVTRCYQCGNSLRRSKKMQNLSTNSGMSSRQTGRKLAICLLAALIVSVMIVWFGFLGWGVIAILQWMLS
jgi:integrase-like protein